MAAKRIVFLKIQRIPKGVRISVDMKRLLRRHLRRMLQWQIAKRAAERFSKN